MHSTNSEEKKPSTSPKVHCPIKSSESIERRSGLIYNDTSLKFDVPKDGSCLLWAVTMAYLIPVKDHYATFQLRYEVIFGKDETAITKLDYVRTLVNNFNPLSHDFPLEDAFAHLVTNIFRNRIVDFIENNLDRFECFSEIADEQYRLKMRDPGTWSSDAEIQAISLILNCRINVDGQIFPLVSNTKQLNPDSKRLTLKLFHVRAGDALKANHFNYGLKKRLIQSFREFKVDNNFKVLEKNLGEKCMMGENAEIDCNDHGNNSLENLKESHIKLLLSKVFHFMDYIYYKVMPGISSEVKLEAVCEEKVNKSLHKLEEVYKLTIQPLKDSIQKRYTLFSLFNIPKYEVSFFETFKNIAEKNKLLKFFFIILKLVIDGLCSN